MTDTPRPATTDPCPDPLTQVVTVEQLADRLGVRPATIRQHMHAGTEWLPAPDGRINGGAVWRLDSLADIEDRRRAPGRPRTTPASARPTAATPAPAEPDDDGFWDDPAPA